MKKTLPIKSKCSVTLYPHHSLPLCIPCVNDNTIGWYMNNFINIFYRYEYPTVYDYTDYLCVYKGLLDIDSLTVSTALDCSKIDNFVKYINDHKYIYIWVDQYYLKATEYYQQEHNIHPILVYGYDLNDSIYFCICFSVSKSIYDAKIDIDEFHMAIIKASLIKGCFNQDEFFRLYKVKENITCRFNLNRFVEEVYNYSIGKGGTRQIIMQKMICS